MSYATNFLGMLAELYIMNIIIVGMKLNIFGNTHKADIKYWKHTCQQ